MKKLFILFLLVSYSYSYSQEKSILDLKEDDWKDPFKLAEKFQALHKKPTAEDLAAHKMASKLMIMNLRMQEIAKEAEMKQLKQALENQNRKLKLQQEVEDREFKIACAWSNSKTGIQDGRCWYDLEYSEQVEYRMKFNKFYKK